jgi:hypothetical protein
MSIRIVRRRAPEPFESPLLPARLSGEPLRQALAGFGKPIPIRLRPGERVVDGRVFYSAAWLEPVPTDADKSGRNRKDGGRCGRAPVC